MLHTIPGVPTVIYVPSNIKEDSSIFPCKQFDCDSHVDPIIINTCAMSNIEFEFCDECSSICTNENMECEIDEYTHKCVHKCKDGFFLSGNDKNVSTLECTKCTVCAVNTQVNTPCSSHKNTICQACERGKHMPVPTSSQQPNIQYTCTECPVRSTSLYEGGECVPCGWDSIVVNSTCVKCTLDRLTRLTPAAVTCSDTMQNDLITGVCAFGTEWDPDFLLCIPCSINSYSDASTQNTCVPCMAHYSTDSIGSSICTPCPITHVRPYYERVCRECTPGTYVNHTLSSGCVQCEHGMINIGGMETCVFCDILHVPDKTHTMCVACPMGTIRSHDLIVRGDDVDASLVLCRKCEVGKHLVGHECIICAIPLNLQCIHDTEYIDRCDKNTSTPCNCGYVIQFYIYIGITYVIPMYFPVYGCLVVVDNS